MAGTLLVAMRGNKMEAFEVYFGAVVDFTLLNELGTVWFGG